MSISMVTPVVDAGEEERWRLWRLGYTESSRKAEVQMRVVFAVVVAALAVAVTFQVLTH